MPVVFVRHAMPVVDPSTLPSTWRLSAEGRVASAGLAARWESLLGGEMRRLAASTEPKAIETLNAAAPGATVHLDARFGEVRRPPMFGDAEKSVPGGFGSLVASYLAGTQHEGWEDPDDAVARFDAALRDQLAETGGDGLVIATHGTVLALWFHRVAGVSDPVAFQRGLAFPDVVVWGGAAVKTVGWSTGS